MKEEIASLNSRGTQTDHRKYTVPEAISRYRTWESPDGETRNQINFTLINQREIVINCEVITKAETGRDQRLVRMTLRINKRLARLKTIKQPKTF